MNFAENLLYPRCVIVEDGPAVICATENSRQTVSWRQLRERVRACARAMRALGVRPGDRIAGYVGNHTNALVAMLATTANGAIWTGVSPDTGVHAVLERLRQVEPALLFADNAVVYNGKTHDVQEKLAEVIEALPTLRAAVVFPTVESVGIRLESSTAFQGKRWSYPSFLETLDDKRKLDFIQLEPDTPVYILYSSGTTGSEPL